MELTLAGKMDEDLLNFTAGLCTSSPVWSNLAASLQKSSWARALLLSQATDCQSWRGVGKHLEDLGDADEGNAEREALGISWPFGATAATVAVALPSWGGEAGTAGSGACSGPITCHWCWGCF